MVALFWIIFLVVIKRMAGEVSTIRFFGSHGVSLAGNGDALVSDGSVNSIPHIARITRAFFSRVAQGSSSHCSVLCLRCLQIGHRLARMSFSARCLTRHWLHLHCALLPRLLCSLLTSLPLALRLQNSCLAVLPNSLRSQVMSPTLWLRWTVQKLRRHRKPTTHAMSPSRTCDFSRVVLFVSRVLVSVSHMHDMCMWLKGLTAQVTMECCVHKKHVSSHLAQHGTQYTFPDDSAITEHFVTSHLHYNPPFDQTSNGTSAVFFIWRDLPLRRSNKSVFRYPWPICTRLQVMSSKILQKRTILCRLNRYSSTDRVWHRLMFLLKASRLSLLNRIWTMSKYGPCWLHQSVFTGERSKCWPITSLSLHKRKVSVKFISLSREHGETRSEGEYGETRCAVFKQKEVESRSTFRQRRSSPFEHQQVLGNNEPLFRFSNPENSMKSFPEE